MPIITLRSGPREVEIAFNPGLSLREILHLHHVWVTSYCGGGGACGRCRVRVAGADGDVTSAERTRLSRAELEDGVRLACQVRPVCDLVVALEEAGTSPRWRDMHASACPEHVAGGVPPAWYRPGAPLGAAVDVGTTHVRVSLWDAGGPRIVARRWTLNPQIAFGADVLSRLCAATDSAGHAVAICERMGSAIGGALSEMARHAGWDASGIGEVVLVGNTAMLALMGQCDPASLLDPDGWMQEVGWDVSRADAFASAWGIAGHGRVRFARPLAGFVGSDLVAAVAATGLCDGPANSLLIDFGTNSEVALWDGRTLWATSAAGGPAFEGSGMMCGMPATEGAIRRAFLESASPPRFRCEVIGGGVGEGLTGPATVDVIGSLVEAGVITRAGNLAPEAAGGIVVQADPRVVVSKRDVDVFQRAKAAIAAAAMRLLECAGAAPSSLQRVCVCGVFGEHLQASTAQRLGLLPMVPPAVIELHGQAALAGAEKWLLAGDVDHAVSEIAGRARVINLGQDASYDACFIHNLRLQPMRPMGAPPC